MQITFVCISAILLCDILLLGIIPKKDDGKIIFEKNNMVFIILLFNLMLSQMLMYTPGSNISPYAYVSGDLQHITFLGQTFSTWCSLLLLLFLLYTIFIKKYKKICKMDYIILGSLFIFLLCGCLLSTSVTEGMTMALKILLPILIFIFIKYEDKSLDLKSFFNLLTFINYFLIIQVLLCKLITGKFSAFHYYLEFNEEYFGYYNHPHNFTGLLGVFALWSLFLINKKCHTFSNIILFVTNILLMYISGAKSYVISLLCALALLGIKAFMDKKLLGLRKYVIFTIFILIIFGGALWANFGANRVVGDVTSGRIDRWLSDLIYFRDHMTIFQKTVGGGFDQVYLVNKQLQGVYINSLNLFIDFLMNNGILGTAFIISVYIWMFAGLAKNSKNKSFIYAAMIYFFTASFITNMVTYQVVMAYIIFMIGIWKIEGMTGC